MGKFSPKIPNFCDFELLKSTFLYNVEILLKRTDLGITPAHKISSESLKGLCTFPAGIALPQR